MASTDEFNFLQSVSPQTVDTSPYSEKNFNNINDINSGVYSNQGLTLVQFDLSSIYNSSAYTDTNDAFFAIPLVMSAQYSTGADAANQVVRAPPGAGQALLAFKNGFTNLVHQVEIQSGGQVISNLQPFTNVLRNFKLFSTMGATDLAQLSPSYGMATSLDNQASQRWLTVAGKQNDGTTNATGVLPGIGLTNNQPYTSETVPNASATQGVSTPQNGYTINDSLQKRISRVTSVVKPAASATATNLLGSNIYGATQSGAGVQPVIMTAADLQQEFAPYYTTSGNTMIWYDLAVIPVKWLCDVFRSIGLSKKLDMQVRMYLNTGSLVVPLTFPTSAFCQYGAFTSSTFANTCPFTVNSLPALAGAAVANGFIIPAAGTAAVGYLACGCFVARAPTTTLPAGTGGLTLDISTTANPMPSCRFYYSQIKLEPSKALAYEQDNRAKSCVYEDFIFNQYNSIPAQGTFSQLVQSGIRNPLAVCVIPFISGTTPTLVGGAGQLGFSQYASPFDTSPSSYAPLSLTQFQVAIGGSNVFKSGALNYTFENFIEQVSIADSVVSGMGPANVGIMSEQWWKQNRVYWADLSRSSDADKASVRNLVVTFKNNSQVIIDVMIFTIYSSHISVDVSNGRTAIL